jgi:hypothetical protein
LERTSELMQQIRSWSEELLLRGAMQLTLTELEHVEEMAGEAVNLQMLFLTELLHPVIAEGRKVLLGSGDDHAFLLYCARLVQYVQIGGRT